MTRTLFIVLLVYASAIANVWAAPPSTNDTSRSEAAGDAEQYPEHDYTLDNLRHDRTKLAQRRIVFNNDGDELWKGTDGTREGILAARTTGLAGSHVDAIWYWGSDGYKLIQQDGPFAQLYTMPR